MRNEGKAGSSRRAAIKDAEVDLDAKKKKQIITAVSWTNPDAQPVIKKVLKKGKADPTDGTFEYRDQIVQFKPGSDLRDNEDVPLRRIPRFRTRLAWRSSPSLGVAQTRWLLVPFCQVSLYLRLAIGDIWAQSEQILS